MNASVNIYIQAFVAEYLSGRNASHNRIGRLMLREDGTGAIEYFYGKMGEVTKTRRTLIVPNQAIATYVTQWTYDSHNRLVEMIYPDEEKITYSYNLGGLLEKVRGEKSYGYDYITKLGYDKFEQRSYLKYCNVSADGKRVFRMGDNDILGKHGGGPHVNFETLKPNPNKPGKMMVDQNYHVFITE